MANFRLHYFSEALLMTVGVNVIIPEYMGAFPGGQAEGIPLSGAVASVRRRL